MNSSTTDEARIDRERVAAFQSGDRSVFDAIVITHQDMIFGLCCRILDDRNDAEEVAQETFVRAFEALDTFRSESALSTWLYRIAVNLCKNHIESLHNRMKRKFVRIADDGARREEDGPGVVLGSEVHSPAVLAERREVSDVVASAINRLRPDQKIVVILADMEGRPYEEIAQMIGEKIGTVRSRLNRAREFLKSELRGFVT